MINTSASVNPQDIVNKVNSLVLFPTSLCSIPRCSQKDILEKMGDHSFNKLLINLVIIEYYS